MFQFKYVILFFIKRNYRSLIVDYFNILDNIIYYRDSVIIAWWILKETSSYHSFRGVRSQKKQPMMAMK